MKKRKFPFRRIPNRISIDLSENDIIDICIFGHNGFYSDEEFDRFNYKISCAKGNSTVNLSNLSISSLEDVFSPNFYLVDDSSWLDIYLINLKALNSLSGSPTKIRKLLIRDGLGCESLKKGCTPLTIDSVDLIDIKEVRALSFLEDAVVKRLMISNSNIASFKGLDQVSSLESVVLSKLANIEFDYFPKEVESVYMENLPNLVEFSGIPLNLVYKRFTVGEGCFNCSSSFEAHLDNHKIESRIIDDNDVGLGLTRF